MKIQDLLIDKKLSKTSGIYLIYCSASEKGYIGRARNIANRWKTHKTRLRHNKHENPHLQRAWNKYGEAVFIFLVVENCDYRIGPEREDYWIRQIENIKTLYNMKTVEGLINFKMSKEAIEKIRQSNLGRKLTDAQKENLRVINTGRKDSKEVVDKRAEANRKVWANKTKGFKITKEDVLMIKEKLRHISGIESYEKLASEYKISVTTIYDIKSGKTWRNV